MCIKIQESEENIYEDLPFAGDDDVEIIEHNEYDNLQIIEFIKPHEDRETEHFYYIRTKYKYRLLFEHIGEDALEKWREMAEHVSNLLIEKEKICALIKNKAGMLKEEELQIYEARYHNMMCYNTSYEDVLNSRLKAAIFYAREIVEIGQNEEICPEQIQDQDFRGDHLHSKAEKQRMAIIQRLEKCIDYSDFDESGQAEVNKLARAWRRFGSCSDKTLAERFSQLEEKYWTCVFHDNNRSRRKGNFDRAISDKQKRLNWAENHVAYLDRKLKTSSKRDYYDYRMKNYYINVSYELRNDIANLKKRYNMEELC